MNSSFEFFKKLLEEFPTKVAWNKQFSFSLLLYVDILPSPSPIRNTFSILGTSCSIVNFDERIPSSIFLTASSENFSKSWRCSSTFFFDFSSNCSLWFYSLRIFANRSWSNLVVCSCRIFFESSVCA